MYARFNGFLRPYQGFKPFTVLRRIGTVTATGRPVTGSFTEAGQIIGMISQASQKEIEQWKQNGHPITHTIVQRGTKNQAKPTDVVQLTVTEDEQGNPLTTRRFLVQGVQDPGEIGHFTVYHVEEREDLQNETISSGS